MRSASSPHRKSPTPQRAFGERRSHAEAYGSDVNYTAVYKRSYGQRRPPLIPPNYSGNAFNTESAFTDEPAPDVTPDTQEASAVPQSDERGTESESEKRTSASPFSDIFRSGIKSEELLLLALIFITAQSESNDVLPYLIMLLFSK